MISPEQSGDIKKNYCGHKIELFLDNLGNQELDNLRDQMCIRDRLKSIEQLFFFVLANSSESKVMDFSGKERIGRINFIKSKNLITTENIVQKAKTDIEFQKKLYDFLLTESESVVQISNKLNEAITCLLYTSRCV